MARLPERAHVSSGQHSVLAGHCSCPSGQGAAVVVVVVGGGGGGGGGIVGRVLIGRALAVSVATLPTTAVPPRPSNPLRIERREEPAPTSLASLSKCLSSIYPLPLDATIR
jgi:hypothetical protein